MSEKLEEVRPDMPFTPFEVKERIDRLNGIYRTINAIPDLPADPAKLARKITLYTVAQGLIGDLFSQAVYDYGMAYNNRKEQQGVSERHYIGTGKEKEAYAEEKVAPLRKIEVKAEAEMKRWEKAYNQTEMLANAIKHELNVVFDDFKQGGRT